MGEKFNGAEGTGAGAAGGAAGVAGAAGGAGAGPGDSGASAAGGAGGSPTEPGSGPPPTEAGEPAGGAIELPGGTTLLPDDWMLQVVDDPLVGEVTFLIAPDGTTGRWDPVSGRWMDPSFTSPMPDGWGAGHAPGEGGGTAGADPGH